MVDTLHDTAAIGCRSEGSSAAAFPSPAGRFMRMPRNAKPRPGSGVAAVLYAVMAVCVVVGTAGCRTAPPLPAVDLSQPGWRSEHGQALWTPAGGKQELAGDLLL